MTFSETEYTSSERISRVACDVISERWRQIDKWGPQCHIDIPGHLHPDSYRIIHREDAEAYRRYFATACLNPEGPSWHTILMEELHEALAEAGPGGDPQALREELVQTAAVIMAWIEDLDGREDG